jgi:hypothetical protein
MPFVIGVLMILQAVFSYLFLDDTFKNDEREYLPTSYLILGFCTTIFAIMQVGGCVIIGRVHTSFKKSLEEYVDFLLMFEETPRSKFAKKYIPPLDVLEEESQTQYTQSIRESFLTTKKIHISSNSGAAPGSHDTLRQ